MTVVNRLLQATHTFRHFFRSFHVQHQKKIEHLIVFLTNGGTSERICGFERFAVEQ